MGIKGYYLKPNFFTGETQKNEITFFLTDGGRTKETSSIMRITNVYLSIDYDNLKAFLVIPKAYNTPFYADFNLSHLTGRNQLQRTIDEILEWLGYKEAWRKVGRTYKLLTSITIRDGELIIDTIKGSNQ